MNRHLKHLTLLATTARDVAPVSAARVAAAVVRKNEILAFGTNSFKTDPFQAKYSKNPNAIFLHAEIDALKKALNTNPLRHVKGSIMYIARSRWIKQRDGTFKETWGNSCPCEGCRRALAAFDISRVYYTSNETGKYVLL